MGKAATLLEGLCGHALSLGFDGLDVKHKADSEQVFDTKASASIRIASYRSSGADAKELRRDINEALEKPLRAAIASQVWIINVPACGVLDDGAFEVSIKPAPRLDPWAAKKQGQYLASIYNYTKIHRRAPAELDLQRHFQVTPPSVHQMILTLELKRFIERTPGQARSIRLLAPPERLPRLE